MSKDFDPKIIGYLCNWCHSVFFFVPQSAVVENMCNDNLLCFPLPSGGYYNLIEENILHNGFGSKEIAWNQGFPCASKNIRFSSENGSKRNSPKPAPSVGRRWDTA